MRTQTLQDKFRLIAKHKVPKGYITNYMIEGEPQRQLTHYLGELYDLPLPWTYYVIMHIDMTEYVKKHKLQSSRLPRSYAHDTISVAAVYTSPVKVRNKKLYLSWLPVSNTSLGSCCFYPVSVKKNVKTTTLDICHQAIAAFWAANGTYYLQPPSVLLKELSPSTNDSYDGYYQNPATYKEWEAWSVEGVLALKDKFDKSVTMDKVLAIWFK